MVAEGPGREDRHDDSADIDARFEEIVAGLRAEHAQSQQRRQEAIRRAQAQRRAQHRPLEGSDNPNPWPPVPRPGPESPTADGPPGQSDASPTTGEPPSRPAEPDRADPAPRTPQPERGRAEPPATRSDSGPDAGPRAPEAWRSWEEPDEEEHFIQPNPPLPAGDLHLWAIVAGLLGGPVLLILSEVFNVLRGDWWTPLAILLSVAGVVLLFLRLPKHRDYTDSSGGAQV